ncbi:MAG: DUF1761 domain-containing protein [Ignavibacteria bacterium]|jgi:hypothetical protein|nr:DUF1761 domain-containing protein [Ignavibacteria bacterium]MCU7503515.1 DUF1761 domain-containing protein [Ignavibacteria bacterium]MCU7517261.1 DUF1761 domain-containing protein [Ignavibacteria bacterium]
MPITILSQIDYPAVFMAACAYFVLGAVWYTPKTFGKKWLQMNYIKSNDKKTTSKVLTIAFLSTLTAALILDYFICFAKTSTVTGGMWIGILLSVFILALTVGVSFIFEEKKVKLQFIDAGYHLIGFMSMGFILTYWR